MAKILVPLLLAIAFAGGCQQQVVSRLPSPTFDPPPQARVTPPPVRPVTPPPAIPLPPQNPSMAGIPREWIPPASAPSRQWTWIVVHHSATPGGGAKAFDRMHREKGWDELGYHFVIGNGTETPDGAIEIGPRWPKQKWGAHARTPDNKYNDHGIGICLVGNFDIDRPTPAQMRSLAKLTAYLMKTYHIPAERVLGHRDTKSTDCPGHNVNLAEVRRMANQVLAESGINPLDPVRTASADPEPAGR